MRVWALDDEAARETLKGLPGVVVWVWDVAPETAQGGVTKQQLQTDVEQQLRRARITVAASTDEGVPSDMALLTVAVTTLRHTESLYAYAVDLAVYQTAVLQRDPTPRSLATWSVGSIALVESSDLRAIFTSVHQKVDQFIQAYRTVNPRARPEGGRHAAARARLRQVQERLQAAGFSPGPLDGRLGPQTRAALRRYQQRQGLRATGSPDPQTLKALRIR
jgi:peptidoglycan hydrolase-like protein with peptidoglycan-binding domain